MKILNRLRIKNTVQSSKSKEQILNNSKQKEVDRNKKL